MDSQVLMDFPVQVVLAELTDSLLIILIYLFLVLERALFSMDLQGKLFKNKYHSTRMLNFSLMEALEDVVGMVEEELMDITATMDRMPLNIAADLMEGMEGMVKMVVMAGVVVMEETRVTF